jgi:hypothetical protein
MQLALGGLHLGDVDVAIAAGISLEALAARLVTLGLRQPTDAMALQATVQGGAYQRRDDGLQGMEAVVQRQQSVPAKGDVGGVFLG